MQPTTGNSGAVEAAFLSREQLQNLNQAACKLGKGVEEIVADIKHHLEQLAEDTPAAREEAIREAVQQWMSKAAAAGAVTGPPSAGGQRAALDRAMEVLEEGQEDLTDALREGEDVPAQRALRLFEDTVAEAVAAIHRAAEEENWPEGQTAERLRKIRAPADHLIKEAREQLQVAAIADWVEEVRSLASKAARQAARVLKQKSTNYTIKEVEFELRRYGVWSQGLGKLVDKDVLNTGLVFISFA